eukprot:5894062-Pyramimonas_sp.AAC.1
MLMSSTIKQRYNKGYLRPAHLEARRWAPIAPPSPRIQYYTRVCNTRPHDAARGVPDSNQGRPSFF